MRVCGGAAARAFAAGAARARGPRPRRRRRAKQLAGVGASRDTGLASGQAARPPQWRGVLGDRGSDCTGKWHSRKLCVGGPAAATAARSGLCIGRCAAGGHRLVPEPPPSKLASRQPAVSRPPGLGRPRELIEPTRTDVLASVDHPDRFEGGAGRRATAARGGRDSYGNRVRRQVGRRARHRRPRRLKIRPGIRTDPPVVCAPAAAHGGEREAGMRLTGGPSSRAAALSRNPGCAEKGRCCETLLKVLRTSGLARILLDRSLAAGRRVSCIPTMRVDSASAAATGRELY